MGAMANLNVNTFASWLKKPRQAFEVIRFDSNLDCNVQCAYCDLPRSDALIDLDAFKAFLATKVEVARGFQFGCQMEPTLDPRLTAFMQAVADSPARPSGMFRLQTNGILLHRHDPEAIRSAGTNYVTVSMDAADPALVRRLRGGTSSRKVFRNVEAFHRQCPEIRIAFVATVTQLNIEAIDDLVAAGLAIGVSTFNLRQVRYGRGNERTDHVTMTSLIVGAEAFDRMAQRVVEKYAGAAQFNILGESRLREIYQRTLADSAGA